MHNLLSMAVLLMMVAPQHQDKDSVGAARNLTRWVAEELRGQDYGTKLIESAEREAIARQCHAAYVDTFSFLALDFYRKVGYTVFA